jgi:hypothetical protein
VRVREAPDAPQGAEEVVEGAVLLDQEDDVVDVFDRALAVVGRDRQRLVEVLRERGRNRGNAHQPQERAAVDIAHRDAPYPSRCPEGPAAER